MGSGTAGASAALFLRRAGHDVTIYERVAHPSAVGAGILLQPTGQRVLARLGLLDSIAAAGAPVRRIHGVLPNGRDLMDLAYREIGAGACAYGLHRGTLFLALLGAARDAGVALVSGAEITAIDRENGMLRTADATLGPFDLVVIADGARSSLRAQICAPSRDRPYPWGALWFVGRSWERDGVDRALPGLRGHAAHVRSPPDRHGARRHRRGQPLLGREERCDRRATHARPRRVEDGGASAHEESGSAPRSDHRHRIS